MRSEFRKASSFLSRTLNTIYFTGLIRCLLGVPSLDADSVHWATFIGSPEADAAEAVAVDDDGSIFVVYSGGDEASHLDFQWGTSVTYVVAKFSSDGSTVLWKAGIGLGYSEPPVDDNGDLINDHPNRSGYGSIAGLAVDPDGNVVLAANMASDSEWPIENAGQETFGGGNIDGAVLKLSADGGEILFSTYFGGDSFDRVRDVQVAEDGSIFLCGTTVSRDFPGAQSLTEIWAENVVAGFFSILSPEGLLQSTFIHGAEHPNSITECKSLALGSDNTLWVAGVTSAEDAFVSDDAFQKNLAGNLDGYLMRLSMDTGTITFASFFGGASSDQIDSIVSNRNGLVAFGGKTFSRDLPLIQPFQDQLLENQEARDSLFIGVLDVPSGQLNASSYFGGSLEESNVNLAFDDASGDVWIAGSTFSNDLPIINAIQPHNRAYKDATFVGRVSPDGDLLFSSFLGGAAGNSVIDMVSLPGGGIVLSGVSGLDRITDGFPTSSESAFPSFQGGGTDAYLMCINSDSHVQVNDSFSNRTLLQSLPITVLANNQSASAEALEPAHADGGGGPFKSLWWTWEAPLSGFLEVTTSARYRGDWDDLFSSSFDTVLSVYLGDALGNLEKIAENDEDPDGLRSSFLRLPVVEGETYQLALDGGREDSFGYSPLTLRFIHRIENDDFESRIVLAGDSPSWEGDNEHSSGENEEVVLDPVFYGKSVWYEWESNQNGVMRFEVEGESFRPHLLVFQEADVIDQLVPVAYYNQVNLDAGTVFMNFQAIAGQKYVLSVDANEGEGGSFVARLESQSGILHDSFQSSFLIETLPFHSETIDNSGSTLEPGEPNLREVGMENLPAGLSLWWSFKSAVDTSLLWYCDAEPAQDVFLGLYQGEGFQTLEPVASMRRVSDQQVAFEAKAGVRYSLMVDQSVYTDPGPLSVSLIEFLPPNFGPQVELDNGNSSVRFSVEGKSGAQYRLEGSSDLIQWEELDVFRLESDQQLIEQTYQPDQPAWFFRLVEVFE